MKRTRFTVLVAAALTCTLLPGLVLADVTVERVTHFGGIMGMAASDIHTVAQIQGLKKREVTSVKFKGAILGTLQRWAGKDKKGGGSTTVTIYRVDRDREWTLHPDKQTYSEQAISRPPEERGADEGDAAPASPKSANGQGEESNIKVVKNEVTVKDTGKTRTINGFKTREYVITWDVETVNTDSGEKSRSLMTSDMWTSDDGKLGTATKEEQAFNNAFMKKKQIALNSQLEKQFGFGVVSVLGVANSSQFSGALKKIKGFPVRTTVTWEGNSEGGANDSGNSGESPQQALQALGSLFGGHKDKKAADSSHPGMTKIFDSTTDLVKVETGKLSGDLFEVPAGYQKD
ncbi:MAG: hypothetical protein PVJ40_06540 [Gammaproteobacteria bacterium]